MKSTEKKNIEDYSISIEKTQYFSKHNTTFFSENRPFTNTPNNYLHRQCTTRIVAVLCANTANFDPYTQRNF